MLVNNHLTVPFQAPTVHDLSKERLLRTVKRDLEEIRQQLPLGERTVLEECIVDWLESFSEALNAPNFPHPRTIVKEYVQVVKEILRGPIPSDDPYPRELFGDKPIPAVRCIVAKMRDYNCEFYDEEFDQEGQLPDELFEQIAQIEKIAAKNLQEEKVAMEELKALEGRIAQQEGALQVQIDQMAQECLQVGQEIKDGIAEVKEQDKALRVDMKETIARQNAKVEALHQENQAIKRDLEINRGKLKEAEAANASLKASVNDLRKKVAKSQGGWLEHLGCIVASVAISWILEKPVMITPNGFHTV